MTALVIRKAAKNFFFAQKEEKISIGDIDITILYARRANRKIKKIISESASDYDFVCSSDFEEINKVCDRIMCSFPRLALRKIASRYGVSLEDETIIVEIDDLNDNNKKILSDLALEVRFIIIISELLPEDFDFLAEDSGICPKVEKSNTYCEKFVIVLKEEFLIKYQPNGKTFYDISIRLPEKFHEYFLPEGHMIFSEYIKSCPEARQNVKIRELMSK